MKLSVQACLTQLQANPRPFVELFRQDALSVEIYKPEKVDLQQPHTQDEIYIIIAGEGNFLLGEEEYTFSTGDFFFVPAGKEHRFENFTDDFATWVIFFGEKKI